MDSVPEGLAIDETRVKISPLVPSIILDYCHMRDWSKVAPESNNIMEEAVGVRKKNEHSLGVLLGRAVGNTITVTNAFGVKYNSAKPQLDKAYIEFMQKYLTKGTKETLVGMFYVNSGSQDINNVEFLKAYNQITTLVDSKIKTIVLNIDGDLKNPTLNIRVYAQLHYNLETTLSVLAVFDAIPYEIIKENMSDIGLDTVLYGQEHFDTLSVYWRKATKAQALTMDKVDQLQGAQKLFDNTEKLKLNISNISDMLEAAYNYVDDVIEGNIEGDPEIGRALNNCLSKISHIDSDSIENLLRDHYQDLLTLSKLTTQIKTQLLSSFPQSAEKQ